MAKSEYSQVEGNTLALIKKLDAVGWGVFFMWIGVAFLADVGWGVGLLGVGAVALGTQATRKYLGLPVEWFWLAIAIVFVLWGTWDSLAIQLGNAPIPGGLLPILFLVVGIMLVVSAFLRKLSIPG